MSMIYRGRIYYNWRYKAAPWCLVYVGHFIAAGNLAPRFFPLIAELIIICQMDTRGFWVTELFSARRLSGFELRSISFLRSFSRFGLRSAPWCATIEINRFPWKIYLAMFTENSLARCYVEFSLLRCRLCAVLNCEFQVI